MCVLASMFAIGARLRVIGNMVPVAFTFLIRMGARMTIKPTMVRRTFLMCNLRVDKLKLAASAPATVSMPVYFDAKANPDKIPATNAHLELFCFCADNTAATQAIDEAAAVNASLPIQEAAITAAGNDNKSEVDSRTTESGNASFLRSKCASKAANNIDRALTIRMLMITAAGPNGFIRLQMNDDMT